MAAADVDASLVAGFCGGERGESRGEGTGGLSGHAAGLVYACGRLPPVPLLEGEPDRMSGWYRQHVVIDGVKHWRLGEGWQVSQAEHLQALGELDGEELRRHRAWRRAGFPKEYRLDKFPDRPVGWFVHGCY